MCRGRIWIWGRLLGLIDMIALIVWTRTRTSAELYESENVFLGRLLSSWVGLYVRFTFPSVDV